MLKPHWWCGLVPLYLTIGAAGCGKDSGTSASQPGIVGASAGTSGSSGGTKDGAPSGGSPSGGGGASGGSSGAPVGGTPSSGGTSTGGRAGSPIGGASGAPSNAGRGGSAGTSGSAASGGSAGGATSTGGADAGGMAGEATTGGTGGASATGGSSGGGTGGTLGTPDVCSFTITGTVSPDIATVGVVDWTTDLLGVTAARIEFSLNDPADGELNVGSGGPISVSDRRALLLGLKPARGYTYRIVATAGNQECVSADQSLTTRADPDAPVVTRAPGPSTAPRANGFIVACSYGSKVAQIVDSDGTVVWWTAAPLDCSRAHLDWDGRYLWMLRANPTPDLLGQVTRVLMDGSGAEDIPNLEGSHHDFAPLPGGATAFMVWDGSSGASYLVERSAGGTLKNVVRLFAASGSYHGNALRYYARDDSYTMSDLTAGITKLARDGTSQWTVNTGCTTPSPTCAHADTVKGNHGHFLTDDNHLLFFSAFNGSGRSSSDPAPAYEYSLSTTGGNLGAKLEWTYVSEHKTVVLGDVARLPNGSTLVTYSTDGSGGVIHEVAPGGELVQSLTFTRNVGYTTFRPTLYGPPQ